MPTLRQMNVPTYECWINMRTRCSNENYQDWMRYGGRGIRVCDRWQHSFEAFLFDMGPKPERMTIERRDNDGDYTPGNCYWATRREQALNRKSSQAAEGRCAREWADLLGVSRNAFHTRVRKIGCEAAVQHYREHGVRAVKGKNA